MNHVDISPSRATSVTIRSKTRQSLKQAVQLLAGRGFAYSEQRLMRDCLRLALKFWRGHGAVAACNKRYNRRSGNYEIAPFWSTEALRRVCWARCHHSGISLSRLMDFAVNCYLPRVIEDWMANGPGWSSKEDRAFWRDKYQLRRHCSDFIISYESETPENNGNVLWYWEKSRIEPWPPEPVPIFINSIPMPS
jgi:hypothetical protein